MPGGKGGLESPVLPKICWYVRRGIYPLPVGLLAGCAAGAFVVARQAHAAGAAAVGIEVHGGNPSLVEVKQYRVRPVYAETA